MSNNSSSENKISQEERGKFLFYPSVTKKGTKKGTKKH